ncbi:hypothetical protein [Leptospira stimsonii]
MEKEEIVRETLEPRYSVSLVARKYKLYFLNDWH